MKRYGPLVLSILLLVVAAIALGCGSHSTTPVQSNPGLIQSITVNPSTADAKDFDGKVQFIATGYYKTPPSPVTPLTVASWGVCQEDAPTAEVAVASSGLAQCMAGANGTYSVFASVITVCNVIGACGGGCQVTGTAQLTCP